MSIAVHVHQLELRAGLLLDALCTLRLAESYGVDATMHWDLLFDALESRTFGALAPPPDEPEPDLDATRPQLERSALLGVACEMAARPAPSVMPTNMLDAAPLLAALPTPLLRRALLRLELRRVAAGDPLVDAEGAAWVVMGTGVDNSGATIRHGALIPASAQPPVAGRHGATVLELSAESWRELVALEPFQRAWSDLCERRNLLAALHGCELTAALSPEGRAALLRGIELVRTPPCTVVEGGTRPPGLFIVTDGEMQMRRHDDAVATRVLRQGAVFGDSTAEADAHVPHDVVCDGPASFALLRVDLLRELLTSEPEAQYLLERTWDERHGIPSRLDTSEVQILDDGGA